MVGIVFSFPDMLCVLAPRGQVEISSMEQRLGVPQSSRFPLYRQLMWHAAAFYLANWDANRPTGDLFPDL